MKTAELLESLTDRSAFELLATCVLRKVEPDCRAIIHFGLNAKGETINAPSDGFCRVPGSDPPHFIWIQHTTTDRERLIGKWLGEGKELGDLTKASAEAQQIRKDNPSARFTVILSTNQRIPIPLGIKKSTEDNETLPSSSHHPASTKAEKSDPRFNLAYAVYKRAGELGVEAIIWEQSRYAAFLDSEQDGQWLRKEFLGVEAEMLSAPLLSELGKKSLAHYRREQFTNPENWIVRQLDTRLDDGVNNQLYKIKFLIGEPGCGKSAAAYQFLERHIASGGFGFSVPEHVIGNTVSLEHALRQTLDGLYPGLLSSEVSRIEEIVFGKLPFVIVVDDVNRAGNPTQLIRKLTAWATSHFLIICPVWPRFWLQMRELGDKPEIDAIIIERMSEAEAIQAIEKVFSHRERKISVLNARQVAWKLALDPFLIGSFSDLLAGADLDDIVKQTDDVVTRTIEKRLAETSQNSPYNYPKNEYQEALSVLVAQMLKNRNLYPGWQQVKAWLQDSPDRLSALRDLGHHGELCQFTEDERFRFFHDRFLEHFALESLTRLLQNPAENKDVLFDPYYAEWIGWSIIHSPQDEDFLNDLYDRLPLALVATIRHIGMPTNDYHRLLIEKVRQWVSRNGSNSRVPESIRGAVANSFINTDSSVVLEIVNTSFGLEVRWFGTWARFRNGDTESGIHYCFHLIGSVSGINRYRNDFWEELVDHVRQYHCEEVTTDLKPILEHPQTNYLSGALVLAGFLRLSGLQSSVEACWQGLDNKPEYFTEIIWAALRCSPNLVNDKLLETLVTYWASPSDIETSQHEKWIKRITERLARAIALDADQILVDYLILQSREHPNLRLPFAFICGMIDLPKAIKFAVFACMELEDDDRRCSVEEWGLFSHSPKLSYASTRQLQELWQGDNNDEPVRRFSFRLWLRNVDQNQANVFEMLAALSADVPFFDDVIRHRAWLEDTTCVPQLIPFLELDSNFFRVAHKIWSEEILPIADSWLESFSANIPSDCSGGKLDEHYHLAEMMILIPLSDAEALLQKHWTHLRYSPLFVHAALYIGTQRLLKLSSDAIANWPEHSDPFWHIGIFFGFSWGFIKSSLTLQNLKNLQPYLHRLDEDILFDYADACYKFGLDGIEWCQQNLPESIHLEQRRLHFPSEEDHFQVLDGYSKQHLNAMDKWLEEFEQRGYAGNPIEILAKWLRDSPNYRKLECVGRCVEKIGSRVDLWVLDVPVEDWWERSGMADSIRESVRFTVRRRTLE